VHGAVRHQAGAVDEPPAPRRWRQLTSKRAEGAESLGRDRPWIIMAGLQQVTVIKVQEGFIVLPDTTYDR
jgi:hypothetical protein